MSEKISLILVLLLLVLLLLLIAGSLKVEGLLLKVLLEESL